MHLWVIAIFLVAFKIPTLGGLWLVWWASKEPTEASEPEADAGEIRPWQDPPPLPRGPRRRGPHGGLATASPSRRRAGATRHRRTKVNGDPD
jgi:hypothetical protein